MNTGPDHEPLDAEEAELARRIRALPGGLPPAELDARIRARAHAAVAAERRPVRPWLWGLSSAAVAVLAVGLFWRAGLPPDAASPAQETPAARAPAGQADTAAELRFEAAPADSQRSPPPPAAAPAAADAVQPATPAPHSERLRTDAPAGAPRPLQEVRAERARSQAVVAKGADVAAALEASIQSHARGSAADWLAHIEALRQAGELDAARAHLRAFREAHPRHDLPEALRGLLDEAG